MYRCNAGLAFSETKYLRRDETTTSTNHVTNNDKISADGTHIFLFKEPLLTSCTTPCTTTLEVTLDDLSWFR